MFFFSARPRLAALPWRAAKQVRASGGPVSPAGRFQRLTGSFTKGAAMPARLQSTLAAALGAFPPPTVQPPDAENKIRRDAWTTHALLDVLWRDGVPDFSLLWLAEPDCFAHANGPGSPQALAAIKSSDDNLGLVLAELDRRGLRSARMSWSSSDHGFSNHPAGDPRRGGSRRHKVSMFWLPSRVTASAPGQLLLVNNGGTVFFYVGGHERSRLPPVGGPGADHDWAGVGVHPRPRRGCV